MTKMKATEMESRGTVWEILGNIDSLTDELNTEVGRKKSRKKSIS